MNKYKVLPYARVVVSTDGSDQVYIDTGRELLPVNNENVGVLWQAKIASYENVILIPEGTSPRQVAENLYMVLYEAPEVPEGDISAEVQFNDQTLHVVQRGTSIIFEGEEQSVSYFGNAALYAKFARLVEGIEIDLPDTGEEFVFTNGMLITTQACEFSATVALPVYSIIPEEFLPEDIRPNELVINSDDVICDELFATINTALRKSKRVIYYLNGGYQITSVHHYSDEAEYYIYAVGCENHHMARAVMSEGETFNDFYDHLETYIKDTGTSLTLSELNEGTLQEACEAYKNGATISWYDTTLKNFLHIIFIVDYTYQSSDHTITKTYNVLAMGNPDGKLYKLHWTTDAPGTWRVITD